LFDTFGVMVFLRACPTATVSGAAQIDGNLSGYLDSKLCIAAPSASRHTSVGGGYRGLASAEERRPD
jgi:hypothetical protein